MIITKTPFRMSFFGGGTDMPEFFNEFGGSVISTSFDKYCYVNIRRLPPFFDYSTELIYSKIERVNSTIEIVHPAIKNAMEMLDVKNLRLSYEADLPARSGLGTSSSFAVGMLHSFYALKGRYVDKKKLADEAIKLERNLCKENGGWQDQIAASFGGLNRIDFKNNSYTVKPIVMSAKKKRQLSENLLMFFTGFTRFSSEMQDASKEMKDKLEYLKEMLLLVDEAEKVLRDDEISIDEFGYLLDKGWKLKKETGSKVSTDTIDKYYDRAIAAGALGGKLLGAGGGGFLIFYVHDDYKKSVKLALKDLLHIPFNFEEEGTKVIYYTSEDHEK